MDISKFTEEEFQEVLEEIYLTYIKNINFTKNKKAFLLGGQPGAGKSGLTTFLKQENENMIVINGDDFRKEHPHYEELEQKYGKESVEYTKGFAGRMTGALISKLSNKGYNLIIEGTLRTIETPSKTQQELSKKGYQVEMAVILVRPEFSYLGTLMRYEEMIKKGLQPRATLKKDHQIVVDNIANNLSNLYEKKIFSNIRLFNRKGECLYSMNKTPEINPGKLIQEEFNRSLKEEEIKSLIEGYEFILNYMSLRNSSNEEIKNVLDLKITIENMLEKDSNNPWIEKLQSSKGNEWEL